MLILPFGAGAAFAADPTPGSSQGGTPGPSAPADLKISTELPSTIKVDNTTHRTTFTATVANHGSKATGPVTLTVLGLDGMKITGVKDCTPVAKNKLPAGTNSGYGCAISDLAPGRSKSYTVSATYDLSKTGKICLPVMEGKSDKVLWQQGPVPFGTTKPTPNAPDTPLLLGTDNVPAAPPSGTASPSPSGTPATEPPSSPSAPPQLPKTGVNDGVLPLAAAGALFLIAGGTGLWWTTRGRRWMARH
ncbi:LPXTG cell wall anchor domain-containing protein [Streptomyces violascens]|uniref:LPXTG cell wall anchor domain-containing protein n=1 Tax=Streptomyces violascens TaxID=67381 RepID=UPI001CFC5449|nr:LPXTG cell wall anchor domain-containing protein [Streptomyces violascens]